MKIKHNTYDEAAHLDGIIRDFDLRVSQLSRGVFQGSLTSISSQELQILELQVNQQIYALGPKSADSLIFSLPLLSATSVVHGIRLASANYIFGFDDQREVDLVTPANGFHLVAVVVSKQLFRHYAAVAGRYDLDEAFLQRNVLRVSSHSFLLLMRYLQQVFCVSQHQPSWLQSADMADLLEKDLLPLLIQTLRPEAQTPALRPYRRADVVAAARAFVEENLQRPLTLDDICQAVSSSKRALTYGFQDIFAMGPMAFLKVQRLNSIRQALLMADPTEQTVADLARSWGFWSLGHFARDYKTMFGEAPSQTLMRS